MKNYRLPKFNKETLKRKISLQQDSTKRDISRLVMLDFFSPTKESKPKEENNQKEQKKEPNCFTEMFSSRNFPVKDLYFAGKSGKQNRIEVIYDGTVFGCLQSDQYMPEIETKKKSPIKNEYLSSLKGYTKISLVATDGETGFINIISSKERFVVFRFSSYYELNFQTPVTKEPDMDIIRDIIDSDNECYFLPVRVKENIDIYVKKYKSGLMFVSPEENFYALIRPGKKLYGTVSGRSNLIPVPIKDLKRIMYLNEYTSVSVPTNVIFGRRYKWEKIPNEWKKDQVIKSGDKKSMGEHWSTAKEHSRGTIFHYKSSAIPSFGDTNIYIGKEYQTLFIGFTKTKETSVIIAGSQVLKSKVNDESLENQSS
jgi:hypothetical protein